MVAPPDWRDPCAYAWLERADRACFAWEWLRRNQQYRGTWRDSAASRFGLVRCEDPDRDARTALPFWSAACDPSVLKGVIADAALLRSIGTDKATRFDFRTLDPLPRLIVNGGIEHVRIGDGRCAVRADLVGAGLLERPVTIIWHLVGVDGLRAPIIALNDLVSRCRGANLGASSEQRAGRWILALRTHDAVVAGASQQDIAHCFFGAMVVSRQWRKHAPSIRHRVYRLVRSARALAASQPASWFA